jgi:two-component sensor histidine kinase
MRTLYLLTVYCAITIFTGEPASARTLRTESQSGIFDGERTEFADSLVGQLRKLRDCQIRAGSLDSAMLTGLQVTAMNGASSNRVAIAMDWQVLASIGQRTGDLPGAVAAARKAVLILKTTGNQGLIASSTLNLMDLLLEAGRFVEFKHLSEEAQRYYEQGADQAGLARILYRQGESLTKQGRAGDALPLLHKALRESPADLPPQEGARMMFALASANAKLAQWSAARSAFQEGLEKMPDALHTFPSLYELDGSIYEGMGDLKNALRCERAQAAAKESALSTILAERLANIRMMYGVQSTEKDLGTVSAENEQLKAAMASNRALVRWLIAIASLMSIVALAFSLLRVKQLHKVRRTQLRNKVLADHAKEMQVKSLDLERQNLRLSHALMEDPERRHSRPESPSSSAVHWIDLILRTQLAHTASPEIALELAELHRRLAGMALLEEHMGKLGEKGSLNLKAHLTELTASMSKEHGLSGKVGVDLMIASGDMQPENLLPICLLIRELFSLSLANAVASDHRTMVRISLRLLGAQQCELLYTDEAGGITREILGNGSREVAMVQMLAEAVGGNIVLLKGEFTSLQFTFGLSGQDTYRKAS